MVRSALLVSLLAGALLTGVPAGAGEAVTIERIDAAFVRLVRTDDTPVTVWISEDTALDDADRKVAETSRADQFTVGLPASQRRYLILQDSEGSITVVGERRFPLEQGSNFRDVGGYLTKDGRSVRWGKAFRSGAMPMLTEADHAMIAGLDLDAVVDLRSLEERVLTDDKIDDRTGALFLSNDYSMRTLFERLREGDGENVYKGMEKLLAPQLRSLYRRLIADEGAVVYHCSAGQDRTGVATALLYDMLGVDRDTILKDYHLSTQWRQPEWEMPADLDPADHPDNPLVQYYASLPEDRRKVAQPLYTPSGASHLAQFFAYLDATYGGSEAFMKDELGFTDAELARLRAVMLD